jgi:Ca-activated chloride channel family protein
VTFEAPVWLLALLLVPALAAVYVAVDRIHARRASAFARAELQPNLLTDRPGLRRHLPASLALLALVVLVTGIARPHVVRDVTRDESTIVLAVDTSRSMAATDVTPSRLEAARKAIEGLIDTVPKNVRIGIVSFSSSAQPVLPPTLDREAARRAVAELRLGSGTALGDAMLSALSLANAGQDATRPAGSRPPAAVLLLSDGAQTTEGVTPLEAAIRARRAGIPISTVALGTRDATVEVPLKGGVVEKVTVPPDLQTLRRVASATRGTFSQALDAEQLRVIYKDLGSRLATEQKRVEVTSAFGAGGGLLLLVAGTLSTLWFRRGL